MGCPPRPCPRRRRSIPPPLPPSTSGPPSHCRPPARPRRKSRGQPAASPAARPAPQARPSQPGGMRRLSPAVCSHPSPACSSPSRTACSGPSRTAAQGEAGEMPGHRRRGGPRAGLPRADSPQGPFGPPGQLGGRPGSAPGPQSPQHGDDQAPRLQAAQAYPPPDQFLGRMAAPAADGAAGPDSGQLGGSQRHAMGGPAQQYPSSAAGPYSGPGDPLSRGQFSSPQHRRAQQHGRRAPGALGPAFGAPQGAPYSGPQPAASQPPFRSRSPSRWPTRSRGRTPRASVSARPWLVTRPRSGWRRCWPESPGCPRTWRHGCFRAPRCRSTRCCTTTSGMRCGEVSGTRWSAPGDNPATGAGSLP